MSYRRSPDMYSKSDLTSIELVVDWASSSDPEDKLQIISYDAVPGVHSPSVIGHFTRLLKKIAQLHQQGIVHGDLRFSNVVFSEPSDDKDDADGSLINSTIIDFD